jgi:hypothetical protein
LEVKDKSGEIGRKGARNGPGAGGQVRRVVIRRVVIGLGCGTGEHALMAAIAPATIESIGDRHAAHAWLATITRAYNRSPR